MDNGKILTEFEKGQITELNKVGMLERSIPLRIKWFQTVVKFYLNLLENYGLKCTTGRPLKLLQRQKGQFWGKLTKIWTLYEKFLQIQGTLFILKQIGWLYLMQNISGAKNKRANIGWLRAIKLQDHSEPKITWFGRICGQELFGLMKISLILMEQMISNTSGMIWGQKNIFFCQNLVGGGSVIIQAGFVTNDKTNRAFLKGR